MRIVKYDPDNVFVKIINGQIPAQKIYEDDKLLVIKDIQPVAPVHVLVVTKGSYIDYSDFINNASAEEVRHYFTKIEEMVRILDLASVGYRLVTNTGSMAGQTIFHFHTHIISGTELGCMG